jgi:hypothetical protein
MKVRRNKKLYWQSRRWHSPQAWAQSQFSINLQGTDSFNGTDICPVPAGVAEPAGRNRGGPVTDWAVPDRDTLRRIIFPLQRPGWQGAQPGHRAYTGREVASLQWHLGGGVR